MSIRNLPIRAKLIAVTTLTALAALLLASGALFFFEMREFRSNLERELSTLADVIGANASAAASFEDEVAAAEFLSALKAESQITTAAIYTGRGTQLARYIRANADDAMPPLRPGAYGFTSSADAISIVAPVIDPREGTRVGSIYLEADFRAMRQRVKTYGSALFAVFGMAALVAFALSLGLQRYISEPILRLSETTSQVSATRDYSIRAEPGGGQEINQLINGFNDMLNLVQQRDRALQAANDGLEMRVQDRTAKLKQEVAERARTEAELAHSLSLVTATLESTADGILVADSEGMVVSFNKRLVEMWQIPEESFFVQSANALLDEMAAQVRDPEAFRTKTTAVLNDRESTSYDTLTFHNGRIFERYSLPQRITGSTVGRVWSFRDITERTRAEERVREQASLLDLAQDAIIVRDMSDVILFWNQGAERIYGWKAEEVMGSQMGRLFHADSERFTEAKKRVVERGDWSGELSQFNKAGREVIAQSRWTLLRHVNGEPKSVLVINTDVTEQKRLEAQFLRAQRMESIGTLAGGIAHDLNNVLSPILVGVELLRESMTHHNDHQLLEAIELSAKRGADLVRQVLFFARGAETKRSPVQVGRILREVYRIARDTFPKSVEVFSSIPSDIWQVIGDPTQVHQVLLNLCVNARDAMPQGGNLSVIAENATVCPPSREFSNPEPAPYVVVRVKDTGCGIPPEIREKIFEPFFTTKPAGVGTGLGLSTVQAIVKGHNGYLELSSEEGAGTTFTVYLPAVEQEEAGTGSIAATLPPPGNDELILLVDDEAAVRLVGKQLLEASGYRVITAPNGDTAISLFSERRNEIALVVTDLMMPGMDGLTLLRTLRTLNPDLRIIAASGVMNDERVSQVVRAGVNGWMSKPFTSEGLLRTISRALAENRA